MRFSDRADAGRALGRRLAERSWSRPVVLGLPRGGVPVAREVADAIGAELDVVVARKIGAPGHPEYGVGAVTADGEPIYDYASLRALGLTEEVMAGVCAAERAEARRRTALYRSGRGPLELSGRDVVVVDDGLATGVTARAAVRSVRQHSPSRIVLAVPVAAAESALLLGDEADEVVTVSTPPRFGAVSRWYRDFPQTTDAEVLALLGTP